MIFFIILTFLALCEGSVELRQTLQFQALKLSQEHLKTVLKVGKTTFKNAFSNLRCVNVCLKEESCVSVLVLESQRSKLLKI